MFKFVETNVDAFNGKRKQPQRACDACRRKKKKCKHILSQSDQHDCDYPSPDHVPSEATINATSTQVGCSASTKTKRSQTNVASRTPATIQDISPSSRRNGSVQPADPGSSGSSTDTRDERATDSRFIGDMNPEGMFLSATSPEHLRSGTAENNVGRWLAHKLGEPSQRSETAIMTPPSSLFYGYASPIRKMFLHILEQDCFATLPPPAHRDALFGTYFEKFQPIFPIIRKSAFETLPAKSSSRILLEQAVCLVASMDFASAPHLMLPDGDTPLPFRDFGRRTVAAMRILIEIGTVTDKIVLMQALALMSFFTDSHEGSETSSLLISRAVQYVFSLGLHIEGRESDAGEDYAETLFCCIWILDRLNAAFQGRPTLMHERDIQRSLRQSFDSQTPIFRLLLYVVELLDQVIRLYRPNNNEVGLTHDFNLFDDLIIQAQATQSSSYMLATIEVLYHAVAILSCRTLELEPGKSMTTASRVRQAFSTEKVTTMVSQEYKNRLILFPFIPYAVTLSLSVNYRDMRRSKIPMCRARARDGFEANSHILKHLGTIFWSASTMADMADITLKELDRVYAQVTESELRRNQRDVLDTSMKENPVDINPSTKAQTDNFGNGNAFHEDPNPFNFTEMPDLDPFAMFDPDFDLDTIDACLEGNLDLGAPAGFF